MFKGALYYKLENMTIGLAPKLRAGAKPSSDQAWPPKDQLLMKTLSFPPSDAFQFQPRSSPDSST